MGADGGSAHHIRCSAVLPPNPRFEDFATEVTNRHTAGTSASASRSTTGEPLRGGILGLAIHDLPLIRTFLTSPERVVVRTATDA